MPERDIFDDIIDLVRRRQLAGRTRATVPECAWRRFVAPATRGGAAPTNAAPRATRRAPTPSAPSPPPAPAARHVEPPAPVVAPVAPTADPVATADWETLAQAVAGCVRCPLHRTRTHPVFGEGDRQADLMFIGEGPGFHEDQSGRPFVGPAGQLLDKMIRAMQFSRETVYIANIVKCRPPGNRNPEDAEAACCLPYLRRQVDLVQPKAIVLLGAVPLLFLLGKTGIGQLHGQWFECLGTPTLPTFHPAFLLRSPARKKEAWEDLQKVMKQLGKDPEQTLKSLPTAQSRSA